MVEAFLTLLIRESEMGDGLQVLLEGAVNEFWKRICLAIKFLCGLGGDKGKDGLQSHYKQWFLAQKACYCLDLGYSLPRKASCIWKVMGAWPWRKCVFPLLDPFLWILPLLSVSLLTPWLELSSAQAVPAVRFCNLACLNWNLGNWAKINLSTFSFRYCALCLNKKVTISQLSLGAALRRIDEK